MGEERGECQALGLWLWSVFLTVLASQSEGLGSDGSHMSSQVVIDPGLLLHAFLQDSKLVRVGEGVEIHCSWLLSSILGGVWVPYLLMEILDGVKQHGNQAPNDGCL